jgi:hypothetical protein
MQDLNNYLDYIQIERTTLSDNTIKAYGKSLPEDESRSIMGRAIPPVSREAHQKGKRRSPVEPNTGHHLTRPAHASTSKLQNYGIACVNLMTITIESSAQRDQLLSMTIVQCQSGRGLACIDDSTRAFGWGISGPYPITSSSGQLVKCRDQPPLLPEAWVSLS